VVEGDETYFGQQERERPAVNRYGYPFTKGGRSGPSGKRAVLALVERRGEARPIVPKLSEEPNGGLGAGNAGRRLRRARI
jgi:hypothetical protein